MYTDLVYFPTSGGLNNTKNAWADDMRKGAAGLGTRLTFMLKSYSLWSHA